MFEDYGINRIIGNRGMLPILAWKLDNRKILYDNEMMLKVKKIHVEAASFKQICNSAGHIEERIKEKIMEIVRDRGKLHNPFTDTGGTLYGVVEKIGDRYVNQRGLALGDEVIVEMSATMIPLYISRILGVDSVYGCIDVEGYCILFNHCPLLKRPNTLSVEVLMLAFEESASIFHVYELAKGQKNFLISGNDVLISLLYAFAIRKATGKSGRIIGLSFKQFEGYEPTRKLNNILELVFDRIEYVENLNDLTVLKGVLEETPKLFDVCVNCSDTVGAEVIDVLASKENGTVFFSSLINNYRIALFLTEGIGKDINILGAYGYAEGYDQFMIEFLQEISEPIEVLSQTLYRMKETLVDRKSGQKEIPLSIGDSKAVSFDLIHKSWIMERLVAEVCRAAKYNCSVLIKGETGVGKEKIATLLHSQSDRKTGPYISVNCASIPENLMESEFFGYEKGAFTGASASGKKGYFDLANNGILLLDEVGELNLSMQSKLLRVLQENEFYRVGGTVPIRTDVRIIAATNRDLKELSENGRFRTDLYYRLNVVPISIPPLRERREDVIPLAEYFIRKYNEKYGMDVRVEDEGLQCFLEYGWPGNIRELENVVQRILINSESRIVAADRVRKEMSKDSFTAAEPSAAELPPAYGFSELERSLEYQEFMERQEKSFLQFHLNHYKSTRKTAEALGMTQAMLMRRKRKYNL